MLYLSRRCGEGVQIGLNIRLTVQSISERYVVLETEHQFKSLSTAVEGSRICVLNDLFIEILVININGIDGPFVTIGFDVPRDVNVVRCEIVHRDWDGTDPRMKSVSTLTL